MRLPWWLLVSAMVLYTMTMGYMDGVVSRMLWLAHGMPDLYFRSLGDADSASQIKMMGNLFFAFPTAIPFGIVLFQDIKMTRHSMNKIPVFLVLSVLLSSELSYMFIDYEIRTGRVHFVAHWLGEWATYFVLFGYFCYRVVLDDIRAWN